MNNLVDFFGAEVGSGRHNYRKPADSGVGRKPGIIVKPGRIASSPCPEIVLEAEE
jgi:hypothetical protein